MNRWRKLGVGFVSSLCVGMAMDSAVSDDFLVYGKTSDGDSTGQLDRCALHRTIPQACDRKVFETAKRVANYPAGCEGVVPVPTKVAG